MKLRIDAQDRSRDEKGDRAARALELSQALREKWFTADIPERRRIRQILCLDLTLDGVSLVPTWRKPFDVLAKGLLVQDGRGDRAQVELFVEGVAGLEPGFQRWVLAA